MISVDTFLKADTNDYEIMVFISGHHIPDIKTMQGAFKLLNENNQEYMFINHYGNAKKPCINHRIEAINGFEYCDTWLENLEK